jgi:hypothetical protein
MFAILNLAVRDIKSSVKVVEVLQDGLVSCGRRMQIIWLGPMISM